MDYARHNIGDTVYNHTSRYAEFTGETELLDLSHEINRKCAGDIDAAIDACEFGNGTIDYKLALTALADQYGLERLRFVLGCEVNGAAILGRYPDDLCEWARDMKINEGFIRPGVRTRPEFLVGLISELRQEEMRHPGLFGPVDTLRQSNSVNAPLEVCLTDNKYGDSAWLKLPAKAEELHDALRFIGAAGGDYTITEIKSAIETVDALAASHSGIDELNMLAHFLKDMDDWENDKLNAVILSGVSGVNDAAGLINLLYEDNFHCFDLIDASNAEELGRYWAKEEPDAIDEDMTPAEYGQQCVDGEKGVFIKHGYVYQRSNTEDIYAGIITEGYKIAVTATARDPNAHKKVPKKPQKSVLGALDKGKEKVARADAARAGQTNTPPSRKRSGQEQGD